MGPRLGVRKGVRGGGEVWHGAAGQVGGRVPSGGVKGVEGWVRSEGGAWPQNPSERSEISQCRPGTHDTKKW